LKHQIASLEEHCQRLNENQLNQSNQHDTHVQNTHKEVLDLRVQLQGMQSKYESDSTVNQIGDAVQVAERMQIELNQLHRKLEDQQIQVEHNTKQLEKVAQESSKCLPQACDNGKLAQNSELNSPEDKSQPAIKPDIRTTCSEIMMVPDRMQATERLFRLEWQRCLPHHLHTRDRGVSHSILQRHHLNFVLDIRRLAKTLLHKTTHRAFAQTSLCV